MHAVNRLNELWQDAEYLPAEWEHYRNEMTYPEAVQFLHRVNALVEFLQTSIKP